MHCRVRSQYEKRGARPDTSARAPKGFAHRPIGTLAVSLTYMPLLYCTGGQCQQTCTFLRSCAACLVAGPRATKPESWNARKRKQVFTPAVAACSESQPNNHDSKGHSQMTVLCFRNRNQKPATQKRSLHTEKLRPGCFSGGGCPCGRPDRHVRCRRQRR
jgi:hypothetical protein